MASGVESTRIHDLLTLDGIIRPLFVGDDGVFPVSPLILMILGEVL